MATSSRPLPEYTKEWNLPNLQWPSEPPPPNLDDRVAPDALFFLPAIDDKPAQYVVRRPCLFCLKERRQWCDRAFPTCARCVQNGKTCKPCAPGWMPLPRMQGKGSKTKAKEDGPSAVKPSPILSALPTTRLRPPRPPVKVSATFSKPARKSALKVLQRKIKDKIRRKKDEPKQPLKIPSIRKLNKRIKERIAPTSLPLRAKLMKAKADSLSRSASTNGPVALQRSLKTHDPDDLLQAMNVLGLDQPPKWRLQWCSWRQPVTRPRLTDQPIEYVPPVVKVWSNTLEELYDALPFLSNLGTGFQIHNTGALEAVLLEGDSGDLWSDDTLTVTFSIRYDLLSGQLRPAHSKQISSDELPVEIQSLIFNHHHGLPFCLVVSGDCQVLPIRLSVPYAVLGWYHVIDLREHPHTVDQQGVKATLNVSWTVKLRAFEETTTPRRGDAIGSPPPATDAAAFYICSDVPTSLLRASDLVAYPFSSAGHIGPSGTPSITVPQNASPDPQPLNKAVTTLACNDGSNVSLNAVDLTSHLPPPRTERTNRSKGSSLGLSPASSHPEIVHSDMETSDIDGVPLASASTMRVQSSQASLVKMLFPAAVKKKKPALSVPVAAQQRGRKVWNVDEFSAPRPPTKKGFTTSNAASSSKDPRNARSSRPQPPPHPRPVSRTSTSHADKPSGLSSQVLSRTNPRASSSSGQKKPQPGRHSTASVSTTPSAASHMESPLILPADISSITSHSDAPPALPSSTLPSSRRLSGRKELQPHQRSTATPPSRVDPPLVLPTGELSERNELPEAPPRILSPPDIPTASLDPATSNLAPKRNRPKFRRRRDAERPPHGLDRTGFRSREEYDSSSDSDWSASSSGSEVSAVETAPTSAAPTPSLSKYLITPQDLCFPTFETSVPDRVTQQGVINAMFDGFICAKCRRANYRREWGFLKCSNCGDRSAVQQPKWNISTLIPDDQRLLPRDTDREDNDVTVAMSSRKEVWDDAVESILYMAHDDERIRIAHVRATGSTFVDTLDDILLEAASTDTLRRTMNRNKSGFVDYYLDFVGEGSLAAHPDVRPVSFSEAGTDDSDMSFADRVGDYMLRCASRTFLTSEEMEPWNQQVTLLGSDKSPNYTNSFDADVWSPETGGRVVFAIIGSECHLSVKMLRKGTDSARLGDSVEAEMKLLHGDFVCLESPRPLKYIITRKGFGALIVGLWAPPKPSSGYSIEGVVDTPDQPEVA